LPQDFFLFQKYFIFLLQGKTLVPRLCQEKNLAAKKKQPVSISGKKNVRKKFLWIRKHFCECFNLTTKGESQVENPPCKLRGSAIGRLTVGQSNPRGEARRGFGTHLKS